MKRLSFTILATLLLSAFVFTLSATAASGKAHIPAWISYDSTNSIYHLSISNLTSAAVSVDITLFDEKGIAVTSTHFYNEPNSVGSITSGANTFTLSPRSSKIIHLGGLESHGWGIIEWTQTGTTSQALIASSWVKTINGNTHISVNSGKAF